MARKDFIVATKDGQEAEFHVSAFESVWKEKGWSKKEDKQQQSSSGEGNPQQVDPNAGNPESKQRKP